MSWWVDPQAEAEARRYVRRLQNMGVGVDVETFLDVPKEYWDAVACGTDRVVLKVLKCSEFIARPTGWKAGTRGVVFKYPNGMRAYAEVESLEQMEQYVNGLHVVRGKKVERVLVSRVDVNLGKHVVDELGTFGALGAIVGWSAEYAREVFWRWVPVVAQGLTHVLELSNPSTGKTTWGKTMERVLGWWYSASVPTPAVMVYNAQTREWGIVVTRNGVVLDEVDKWRARERENLRSMFATLNAGMETGTWNRGVGAPKSITREIPVVMFGNFVSEGLVLKDARDIAYDTLSKSFGNMDVEPLLERFNVIVVGRVKRVETSDVLGRRLRPSVARAVVYYLHQQFESTECDIDVSDLRKRKRACVNRRALRVLGIEDYTGEELVQGLTL